MLAILNKILADHLDTDVVMDKLNEIEKQVQDVAKSIPRSRILSEERRRAFYAELSKEKGYIYIVLAGSSDDVYPLAQQICDAAKAAKWDSACPMGRNSITVGEPEVEGLECYAEDWESKGASAFRQAMNVADLPCNFVAHQWVPHLRGRTAMISGYEFNGGMPTTNAVTILVGRAQRSVH